MGIFNPPGLDSAEKGKGNWLKQWRPSPAAFGSLRGFSLNQMPFQAWLQGFLGFGTSHGPWAMHLRLSLQSERIHVDNSLCCTKLGPVGTDGSREAIGSEPKRCLWQRVALVENLVGSISAPKNNMNFEGSGVRRF